MTDATTTAVWLRDDAMGLRAPVLADAEVAAVWHEGPLPRSGEAARDALVAEQTVAWGNAPSTRLIAVDLASGAVVGGALVERGEGRRAEVRLVSGDPARPADERDMVRAAVLRLLVPWALSELGMMTVRIDLPADDAVVLEAARELGLREAVRLREHVRRPGGRVDLLMLERVEPGWGRMVGDDDA